MQRCSPKTTRNLYPQKLRREDQLHGFHHFSWELWNLVIQYRSHSWTSQPLQTSFFIEVDRCFCHHWPHSSSCHFKIFFKTHGVSRFIKEPCRSRSHSTGKQIINHLYFPWVGFPSWNSEADFYFILFLSRLLDIFSILISNLSGNFSCSLKFSYWNCVLSSQCQSRGLEDFVEFRGGDGLDPSLMESAGDVCGLESTPCESFLLWH